MSEEGLEDGRRDPTLSEGPQSVDATRKRQGQELEEDASKTQDHDVDWSVGSKRERAGGKEDNVVIGEEEQQDQKGSRAHAPKASENSIVMGSSSKSGQKGTHQKRRKEDTKLGGGLQASSSSSSSSSSGYSSSSSSSSSSLFGGRATRQTEAIAVEEEEQEEEDDGEEDDPEVGLLLPILKSITATSSLAGVTSTDPQSTTRVHMLHLLDAVKAALVPRFRTDHGQGAPESTFEKGVALVSDALAAPPNIVPTTAILRLASFLDRTLGFRERHLTSQSIDVQRCVTIYGDDGDLSAIFLCL
jgi:hypothetical protein